MYMSMCLTKDAGPVIYFKAPVICTLKSTKHF